MSNPYLEMSIDEINEEIDREEAAVKDFKDQIRTETGKLNQKETDLRIIRSELRDLKQVSRYQESRVLWRGQEIPNDAWRKIYRRARTLKKMPDSGFYNKIYRSYGLDSTETFDIFSNLLFGRSEVEFEKVPVDTTRQISLTESAIRQTEREITNLKGVLQDLRTALKDEEHQIELKKEAKKRVREQRPCRIWEYTKYYKYTSTESKNSKNNRHFEVKVPLVFLVEWGQPEVEGYTNEASALCDTAMSKVFGEAHYDEHTWEDIYEAAPLVNELEIWAKGWEEARDATVTRNVTHSQVVVAEVEDKIGHYWRGTRTVRLTWMIPLE